MSDNKVRYATYPAISKYQRDRWEIFIKQRNLPDGSYIWTGGHVAFNTMILSERTIAAAQEFQNNGLQ